MKATAWGLPVLFATAVMTTDVAAHAQRGASLKTLALALAQLGHPTGLVASLDEFESLEHRPSPLPGGVTDRELTDLATTRPDFRVEERGRSVRLIQRSAPTGIIRLLERPGLLAGPVRMSASAAVVHVVGSLLKQRSTGGVLGSGLSPQKGCDIDVPVTLPAGSTSAFDLLDRITAQGHGLAWFILYDPEDSARLDLGLWCADGMYFRVQLGE